MTFNILLLTGEQIRAARALARIEQTELARRATLSLETIKRLERIRGPVEANARTLRAIQRAFEEIGIGFQGDDTGSMGVFSQPLEALTATPPATAAPRMRRLIYHGRLRASGTSGLRPVLALLQNEVRAMAQTLSLTGLTLIQEGQVLQAIEGEQKAVETALQRLRAADHHEYLTLMDDRTAGQRVFSDMGFCCGRFPQDEAATGPAPLPILPRQLDHLSATEAVAVLMAARKRQQDTPRNNRLNPSNCPLANQCLDGCCNDKSLERRGNLNPQVQ